MSPSDDTLTDAAKAALNAAATQVAATRTAALALVPASTTTGSGSADDGSRGLGEDCGGRGEREGDGAPAQAQAS